MKNSAFLLTLALFALLLSSCRNQSSLQIICFGDSLTAGPNIKPEEKYPALLEKILKERGFNYEVVNAGVSGETTVDGLRRIDSVLGERAGILILEFGTNDVFTNVPPEVMERNLAEMIRRAKARNITVVLAGIISLPGAPSQYHDKLPLLYRNLAEKENVRLIPDFLRDVSASPGAMRRDGVHYRPEGARLLAQSVFREIEPLLKKQEAATTGS